MSDYVLLLDADMVLEIKTFDKKSLAAADSFYILQGNDAFYYQNMRIVKNNGLYSYAGVTHEYINTPSNNRVMGFEKKDLFIRDLGDGGSKHDKFERDVRLLTEGIKDEPKNDRYHFYLANSYHDSGKFEEAIDVYKKRIELGGWKEEVWYSHYRIGNCYKNLGKINDAIHYWMNGYQFYPERLEGLYEIIRHYRIEGKQKLAYMFYKEAKQILDLNHKRDTYLFLHDDIYTSKLYYEFTVFAAYVGINNINDWVQNGYISAYNIINFPYNSFYNENSSYKGFRISSLITTSSLIPLIDTTENYLVSEFNPLINNVDIYPKSNIYYDLDYSNGMSSPTNLPQVIQTTATKASINDSNYSRESWNNIRYRGSRVTSPGINKT
jgi:tetratricopeptide (TPR) repeat protein